MWSALKALQAAGGGAKDGGGLLTHTDTRSKAELRECAHAAAALVQRLATRGGVGSPPQPEQPLPASYVSHAQASTELRTAMAGLAFLFTSKGGLGVSFEHGWGCVIQRLGKRAADGDCAACRDDGCQWSGPAFVRINNFGLGLTVGYDSLETVLVLGNRQQVAPFKRTELDFSIDGSLILGRDCEVVDEDAADSPRVAGGALQQAAAPIAFSIGDGALFDLSLKGSIMSADQRMNEEVYGRGATASGILEGQHPAPFEFGPLYAVLTALTAQHQAVVESGSRKAKQQWRRRRSGSPTSPLMCLPEFASPRGGGGSSGSGSDGTDSPEAPSPEAKVLSSAEPKTCRQRSSSRSASPETDPDNPTAAEAGSKGSRKPPPHRPRRLSATTAEVPEKRNS